MRDALKAAPQPEPSEWVMVPLIPTDWMLRAGSGLTTPAGVYSAMLAAAPQPEPVAYLCPGGCGCTWRDNRDGSMSLLGRNSQSCGVCEPLPLSKLIPLYAHPQRSYEPLTHMQAVQLWGHRSDGPRTAEIVSYCRAIERAVLARLGIKEGKE